MGLKEPEGDERGVDEGQNGEGAVLGRPVCESEALVHVGRGRYGGQGEERGRCAVELSCTLCFGVHKALRVSSPVVYFIIF